MSHRSDFWTGLFSALLLAVPGLAVAQSPTPVTSIVNSAEDTTLEVNHNGSLLVPGDRVTDGTENDSIPAEGLGTRLMWYPAKLAFRAGRLSSSQGGTGDEWDAGNIGYGSVAFGLNTTASGTRSVAFGLDVTASNLQSVAMGAGTVASGDNAIAMGDRTVASNFEATALGRETEASGRRSTAMGFGTFAANDRSLSVGECNNANSEGSTDDALFVVGNGNYNTVPSACEPKSDALVLDQDGNLEVSGSYVLPDGTVLDESSDLGVSLPFEESVSSNVSAFRVTNTGSGGGIEADVDGDGEAARFTINSSSNSNDNLALSHRGTGPFIRAFKITSSASNLRFEVDNDGNVSADGTISGGGADVAEAFEVEGRPTAYKPGDVLTISTETDRTVTKSQSARSTRVVGVYATEPGVLLSKSGAETPPQGQVPMGVVGVIPTKVSAENGPIQRGDLLVTAETPGHAMKAQPKTIKGMKVYPHGAILGKALEAFEGPGTGLIEVMVNVK